MVGSFLRKDHPLFAQRLRQAARKGAQIHRLHALDEDWAMPLGTHLNVAPSGWLQVLADVAAAVAAQQGHHRAAAGHGARRGGHRHCRSRCWARERKALLLGNAAAQHPRADELLALANWIAEHTGASVGYLGEAANSVGAQLVGALPGAGGLNAGQMLSQGMKALLLLNVEPELDAADAPAARAALQRSGLVVALTAFKDAAVENADVLLPIAPFTETAGSFVNAEGRLQSFSGVVAPLGETRPAWKVLRVLGNLLGLPGFQQDSAEQVRSEAMGDPSSLVARLDNRSAALPSSLGTPATGFERIADVPIYAADALVRRAESLQLSADARAPVASLPSALWAELGLKAGDPVRITQGEHVLLIAAVEDPSLAPGVVRVPAGHADTAVLGAMFGAVNVTRG